MSQQSARPAVVLIREGRLQRSRRMSTSLIERRFGRTTAHATFKRTSITWVVRVVVGCDHVPATYRPLRQRLMLEVM